MADVRPMRIRTSVLIGACLALAQVRPVRAEPELDASRALALFRDGRALVGSGQFEAACPKFEQSLKLDPGIGTRFNLADCYEHIGRTATARQLFLEVAASAHESGQAEREQAARARAKALELMVHTLTIVPKGEPSGVEIRRDDTVLEKAAWGLPQPVDPGFYEIRVTAPGKVPWHARVEVPLSGDVTLEIPALKDADAEPPSATAASAKAPPETTTEAPPTTPPEPAPEVSKGSSSVLPTILYAGAGAGVLVALTGLVLYKTNNSDAGGICPKGVGCTPDEVSRHDQLANDARTGRTVAYIGLGLAGASVITAGVVALSRSHSDNGEHAVSAGPMIGPGTFGAVMRARF